MNADSDSETYYPPDDYDVMEVNATKQAHELLAIVKFHSKHSNSNRRSFSTEGKVDMGAMVPRMPAAMLPNLGLSRKDILPSYATLHGATGTNLKCIGMVQLHVTCNHHHANAKFFVNTLGTELILGFSFCKEFQLVKVSEECMQRPITSGAVHILSESDFDYRPLQKKL